MMKHKIPVEWMQRYERGLCPRDRLLRPPWRCLHPGGDHLPALDAACRGRVGRSLSPREWRRPPRGAPHGAGCAGRVERHPARRPERRYYTYTVQIDGKNAGDRRPLCRGSGCERPAQHGSWTWMPPRPPGGRTTGGRTSRPRNGWSGR